MIDRDALEAALAQKLGKLNRELLNEIMDALGDPPDLAAITPAFWESLRARFTGLLSPALEAIFVASVEAQMGAIGIGIAWDLVNERAAQWASQYTFDLVSGITETRQQMLQQAVSDFFRQAWDLRDLAERLAREYGPVRSEMIAVTEVTRAVNAGEQAFREEAEKLGAAFEVIWQTANDERTCPICEPRNGKAQGDGWEDLPPAHPNCRCFTNSRPVRRR